MMSAISVPVLSGEVLEQAMSDTTQTLMQLAAKKFKVDASGLSADDDFFDALGIDSVQALELLSDLEMEFDVEVPDYELQGVKTFSQLAEVIDERL